MEKNEEVARDLNPLINLSYDFLSANSFRIGPWNLERHCLYLHLIFQCRLNLIPFYSRPQHRNMKFRAHASRQRADAMTINRMVGQCIDHDWDLVQSRLEPGGSRERRAWRRGKILDHMTCLPVFLLGGWVRFPTHVRGHQFLVRYVIFQHDLIFVAPHEHCRSYAQSDRG